MFQVLVDFNILILEFDELFLRHRLYSKIRRKTGTPKSQMKHGDWYSTAYSCSKRIILVSIPTLYFLHFAYFMTLGCARHALVANKL